MRASTDEPWDLPAGFCFRIGGNWDTPGMTIAPAEFFGSGATRHTEPPRTERVTPTELASVVCQKSCNVAQGNLVSGGVSVGPWRCGSLAGSRGFGSVSPIV